MVSIMQAHLAEMLRGEFRHELAGGIEKEASWYKADHTQTNTHARSLNHALRHTEVVKLTCVCSYARVLLINLTAADMGGCLF